MQRTYSRRRRGSVERREDPYLRRVRRRRGRWSSEEVDIVAARAVATLVRRPCALDSWAPISRRYASYGDGPVSVRCSSIVQRPPVWNGRLRIRLPWVPLCRASGSPPPVTTRERPKRCHRFYEVRIARVWRPFVSAGHWKRMALRHRCPRSARLRASPRHSSASSVATASTQAAAVPCRRGRAEADPRPGYRAKGRTRCDVRCRGSRAAPAGCRGPVWVFSLGSIGQAPAPYGRLSGLLG